MKKLLQVFILICLPLSVFATGHNINGVTNCVNVDGVANPAAVNGVAAEAGGDSWSCTDAALICESFDATGFDNGGSSSATKTGTIIDEDYANTTGVGCDSSNVQSFRFYQTDAGGTGHGVSWDNGSQSVIYVNFWFNVVAITEINRMVHLGDSNPYSDDAFYMLFNPVDSTNYTITATAHSGSLGTTGNLNLNATKNGLGYSGSHKIFGIGINSSDESDTGINYIIFATEESANDPLLIIHYTTNLQLNPKLNFTNPSFL